MFGRRLDVKEAAEVLGISSEGVRKRIKRGTLESEKDSDGKVYVWLDDGRTSPDERSDGDKDALVQALRDQVDMLQGEVAAWREEARRKDHLLAASLERIPAIGEAPPEARDASETAPEGEEGEEAPLEQEKPVSWWRRWFGTT